MKITHSEFTSAGLVRDNNQDSIFSAEDGEYAVFAVADGMGGHFGGEIASSRLTSAFSDWWSGFTKKRCEFHECCQQLKELINNVNDSIFYEFSQTGKIGGTTLALLFIYESQYLLINVGDSRIYCLNKGNMKQESVDHIFSAEARLSKGLTDQEISRHKNRNKLTSAVGCKQQFKMNVKISPLTDCVFFICTDGVYKYCSESDIKEAVSRKKADKTIEQITDIVESNGASDNFSFIKITVGKGNTGTLNGKFIAAVSAAAVIAAAGFFIAGENFTRSGADIAADTQPQSRIFTSQTNILINEAVSEPVHQEDEVEITQNKYEPEEIYVISNPIIIEVIEQDKKDCRIDISGNVITISKQYLIYSGNYIIKIDGQSIDALSGSITIGNSYKSSERQKYYNVEMPEGMHTIAVSSNDDTEEVQQIFEVKNPIIAVNELK